MSKVIQRLNSLGLSIKDSNDFIDLDPDHLIKAAIKSTGLDDFGDMGWYPYFCRSVNDFSEKKMTVLGRLIVKYQRVLELQNRLSMVDFVKKNPHVVDQEIQSPVLILGNPRSGTSILYETLAQDQNLRAPLGWEAIFPTGLYSEADRRCMAESIFDLSMEIDSSMRKIHELSWKLPTEHLMTMAFDYHDVTDKNASRNFCGWLKISLQILQCRDDRRVWLIKNPQFMMVIDDLISYFPDARIIHLHRDPACSMASLLSLLEVSSSCIESLPPDYQGEVDYWELACKKMINLRNENFKNKLVDVMFKELVDNPFSAIRKIYGELGMALNDRALDIMSRYLKGRPRHKKGKHTYDLKNYGFGKESIRKRFHEYINYYSIPLEEE